MPTFNSNRGYVSVFSLLVLILVSSLLGPTTLRAQGTSLTAANLLREANAKIDAGQLLDAEQLYRRALESADGLLRPACLDGLISLNVHLGRHDQAIAYGLRYQEILYKSSDLVRWREVTLKLGESYLALGQYREGEKYLEDALSLTTREPLKPITALTARSLLADSVEKRGDRKAAEPLWRQVVDQATALVANPRSGLDARQKIECTWKLAEAYRSLQEPKQAIARLQSLLLLYKDLADSRGERTTLRMLASLYTDSRQYAEAEACLRQAVKLQNQVPEEDRLAVAELWNELAEICRHLGQRDEVDRCRDMAAKLYTGALREPKADRRTMARTTMAFWRLEQLYQKRDQLQRALKLVDERSPEWNSETWMKARLMAEKGSLELLLGSYEKARPALTEAVSIMEKETPLNLIDFPRTLLSLGVVEQANGNVEGAEKLAKRCLALYRHNTLPEDLTLGETYNLLGTCLALRGNYAEAIAQFRQGEACCVKIGVSANTNHGNLLLNIALLHKAQGDTEEALRYALHARDLYQTVVDPESLEMASLYAALADLQAARGNYQEANVLAETILKLCARHQVSSGRLMVTAHHCQALYHLANRHYVEAEAGWKFVLGLQQKDKQTLLVPRTLNYLGHAAELQNHRTEAATYYRRALALQEDNSKAFPATHFISLWRLANLAERAGRMSEAIDLLERGMTLVETVRLRTYGDAQQRAAFFAQFNPAFDQLVDWSIKAGQLDEAFIRAARTRSRTLLDQLQLAGADPRQTLQDSQGKQLVQQEKMLREQLGAIQARAALSAETVSEGDAKKLNAYQQEYALVWREILNRSPIYRNLGGAEEQSRLLATVRDKVLGPKNLLLFYYLGQQHSYVMLLGDRTRPTEVFPLTVSSELLTSLTSQPSATESPTGRRGTAVRLAARPVTVSKRIRQNGNVLLTREWARFLVDYQLQQIDNPESELNRSTRVQLKKLPQVDKPAEIDNLADVFLPPAVRERIKKYAPDQVLVVPDGPLHKLPLEALPLNLDGKPLFLLDELPPLIYAPSATVLALLAERPKSNRSGPLSLLTVSNPAYANLDRLPKTAEESSRIQKFFAPGQVQAFTGAGATKPALVKGLEGRPTILHLATHGFVDASPGNLFGALALTPPQSGQEKLENNGWLSLHEIYALPLQACELAVLSACETNVGPQRPLEAGITLAGAFLAAGAHRVVASHWSVDDESTAELMSAFFEEATKSQGTTNYALALQKARLKLRNSGWDKGSKWAKPYYWAPFVLIGPPDQGMVR